VEPVRCPETSVKKTTNQRHAHFSEEPRAHIDILYYHFIFPQEILLHFRLIDELKETVVRFETEFRENSTERVTALLA
jgi:hypothetical protein